MTGYQITFFTQQDRMHEGTPLAQWLLTEAQSLKLRGGTVLAAAQGFGHGGKMHSAGFVELADQPQLVMVAASEEECARLLARLAEAGVEVFYTRAAVQFGTTGAA